MFEWIVGLLKSTIEYQGYLENGWTSPVVFTACAASAFTVFQGYGLWKQGRVIWREKSAQGISILMALYFFFYFAAMIFYGLSKASVAIIFSHAFIVSVQLYVVTGIIKFRGLAPREWLVFACFGLIVPAMIAVENKDVFLLILLGVLMVTMVSQTIEVYKAWRKGNPGVIEPLVFVTIIVAGTFWFLYGLYARNWVYVTFNPVAVVNFVVALLFWHLAKKKKVRQNMDAH